MRIIVLASLVPLVLTAAPERGAAQPDSLTPGRRVMVQISGAYSREARLRWPQGRFAGVALAVGDTLRLASAADSVSVPADRVERMWMSVRPSRRSDYALKGAGIGALAGALVGYGVGEDCTAERLFCFSRSELALQLGLGGAVGGALLGAAMGGELWREVRGLRSRVSLAPAVGGVALGVRLERTMMRAPART